MALLANWTIGAGLEAGFGDKEGESEGDVDDEEETGTEDDGNLLSKVVEKVNEIDIQDGTTRTWIKYK